MPQKEPRAIDMEAMSIEDLIEENIRLGNLPEYMTPDIVQQRLKINEVRDQKIALRNADLRARVAAGELTETVITVGNGETEDTEEA